MKARVYVMPKEGVLDPQGKAISHALASLGFKGVGEVRQGKVIDLELAETDKAKAKTALEAMCMGHTIADVVGILGSLDIVLGEVDR